MSDDQEKSGGSAAGVIGGVAVGAGAGVLTNNYISQGTVTKALDPKTVVEPAKEAAKAAEGAAKAAEAAPAAPAAVKAAEASIPAPLRGEAAVAKAKSSPAPSQSGVSHRSSQAFAKGGVTVEQATPKRTGWWQRRPKVDTSITPIQVKNGSELMSLEEFRKLPRAERQAFRENMSEAQRLSFKGERRLLRMAADVPVPATTAAAPAPAAAATEVKTAETPKPAADAPKAPSITEKASTNIKETIGKDAKLQAQQKGLHDLRNLKADEIKSMKFVEQDGKKVLEVVGHDDKAIASITGISKLPEGAKIGEAITGKENIAKLFAEGDKSFIKAAEGEVTKDLAKGIRKAGGLGFGLKNMSGMQRGGVAAATVAGVGVGYMAAHAIFGGKHTDQVSTRSASQDQARA